MAALLAKQSGASRTSPILRGNWLLESLLGEKLPKPPKNVPQLPESELDTGGLTMRQITEKHRERRVVRQVPRSDRPLRLRAGVLRRDRQAPHHRPGRTSDQHAKSV